MPNSIVHDEAWHDAIYVKFAEEIRGMLARRLPGDLRSAEDLTQETFITAWIKRDLVPDEELKGWLFKTALNHLRNHRRSLRSRQFVELDEAAIPLRNAAAPADLAVDEFVDVRKALSKLPRKDQDILDLAVIGDLDSNEIGSVLGLKPPTVRKRIERALARARELLRKENLDPYAKG